MVKPFSLSKNFINLIDIPAKNLRKINRKSAADGGSMSHVGGYSPVLGNNRFGYPSGGVNVRTPAKRGGAATHGLGRAFMKGGRV